MVPGKDEEVFVVNYIDEQDLRIEVQEIKDELNKYLGPFPKSFKRKLIKEVKDLRQRLETVLKNETNEILNVDIINSVSKLLTEFFHDLEFHWDLADFSGETKMSDETKGYLFSVIEKYITTIYYGPLFQLVEIAYFEDEDAEAGKLEQMVSKYRGISAKHLNLNLTIDDEDVRVYIYSAIRSLLLITSVKSPSQKLNCISQFCKFVMEAIGESKETGGGQFVSADEWLPALIYSLLKADIIPQLWVHIRFIEYFCKTTSLGNGKIAYDFTNFNAALNFIERLDEDTEISLSMGALKPTSHNGIDNPPTYFNESVNIIHDEVRAVNQKRRFEVLTTLRDKILESQKLMAHQISDMKEKKYWNVIKWIPVVNVGYGGIRSICYKIKGNKEEALNSLVGVAGGIAGVGAGVACAAISGPLIIPIVAGLVASGSANQAITGGGELAIETHGNPDKFKALPSDAKEKKIYTKMIKDAPIVGMLYSSIRSTVYLAKGNKKEAKSSVVNATVNTAASGVGILAGVGLSKLSARLTSVASAAMDTTDDIVKPMSTELIEFIATQSARIASNASVNAAVHLGANSLSRIIIEENMFGESDDCLF